MLTVALASAVGLVVLFVAVWLLSLRLANVAIVDVVWGPSFALVAWIAGAVGDAPGARPVLVAVGATVWGFRLGLHLLRRAWGQPEDRRYAAMRRKRGERFAVEALWRVFLLQGALVLVVSLPLQAVGAAPGHRGLGWLDGLAIALWAVGLAFEAIGDEQLRRFKADPANAGRVMDRGLWAWTRHPNYFGDLVVWCGFGAAALAVGAWWALTGTAIMGWLLVAGSGKPMLERTIADRRPGYADYVERTSGFVPLPPRRPRPTDS